MMRLYILDASIRTANETTATVLVLQPASSIRHLGTTGTSEKDQVGPRVVKSAPGLKSCLQNATVHDAKFFQIFNQRCLEANLAVAAMMGLDSLHGDGLVGLGSIQHLMILQIAEVFALNGVESDLVLKILVSGSLLDSRDT